MSLTQMFFKVSNSHWASECQMCFNVELQYEMKILNSLEMKFCNQTQFIIG